MNDKKALPSGRDIPTAMLPFDEANMFLREVGNSSRRTRQTYTSALRMFADWLQTQAKNTPYPLEAAWPLSPTPLTNSHVTEFRNWLLAHRSQTTANTYMAAVLGYLHYLNSTDTCPEGIHLSKLMEKRRRRKDRNMAAAIADKDEIRQGIPEIVHYYNSLVLPPENDKYNRRLSILRNRAFVNVLYSTAARLSEVLALTRSQVQHGRLSTATITGKGNRPRTVHFLDYAQEAIRVYLNERTDDNPALFISHSRNGRNARLSQFGAHKVIKAGVVAMGLDESLSAHDFRHYRATQLLRDGVPLEVLQEYLGHEDISTTRGIYAPVLGVGIVRQWLERAQEDEAIKSKNEGEGG